MSTRQITDEAMALPLPERVSLAQRLWESIDAGLPQSDEAEAVADAARRDAELSSGKAKGVSHKKAIEAARRAIACE
jgi:putative addiction module component (TIGR02574 family)